MEYEKRRALELRITVKQVRADERYEYYLN